MRHRKLLFRWVFLLMKSINFLTLLIISSLFTFKGFNSMEGFVWSSNRALSASHLQWHHNSREIHPHNSKLFTYAYNKYRFQVWYARKYLFGSHRHNPHFVKIQHLILVYFGIHYVLVNHHSHEEFIIMWCSQAQFPVVTWHNLNSFENFLSI